MREMLCEQGVCMPRAMRGSQKAPGLNAGGDDKDPGLCDAQYDRPDALVLAPNQSCCLI